MMSTSKSGPWKVFIAIIIGMVVGIFSQPGVHIAGIELYNHLYPLYVLFGKLFINALMLLVVPLVSSSIISGIARIGGEQSFGRLGAKTFFFYLFTNLLAILVGALCVNLFNPGSVISAETIAGIQQTANIEQLTAREGPAFSHILLQIVPANIIHTFSQGQMLGIIFFSLIFGYCISKIQSNSKSVLEQLAQGVFETMIQFTHVVMKVLPLGVFFLVAKVFAETGLQSLRSLGLFTLTVIVGLIVFMVIVLPLVLKTFAKVKPSRHFKAMGPALITAFSTSSSSASLPITMDCVEKRAGVSNKIASVVIPLGTSINMSGSALYMCVGSMFVAQVYGVDMSFATQASIVLLSFMMTVGVAGIPSSSLVAIIAILHAIGIPAEGIGLFIAVDRILDMCRTTVNVFSDSCCAVLVARSEGEKNVLSS